MHRERPSRRNSRAVSRIEQLTDGWLGLVKAWIDPALENNAAAELTRLAWDLHDAITYDQDKAAAFVTGSAFASLVHAQPPALAATLVLMTSELLPKPSAAAKHEPLEQLVNILGAFAAGFNESSTAPARDTQQFPAASAHINTPNSTAAPEAHLRHELLLGADSDHAMRLLAPLTPETRIELMQTLLMAMPDVIYLADRNGYIFDAKPVPNDPVPPEQYVGKHVSEIFSPGEAARAMLLIEAALDSGTVQITEYSFPFDGHEYDFEARVMPYGDNEVMVLIRDTTARKRAEATLLQARLYESLGSLSAGVAHVFNNRLMAILGQAELSRAEASPESPIRQRMDQIILSVYGASDLVKQMLAYGGASMDTFEPIALPALLRDLELMLEELKPPGVTLRIELDDALAPVLGDQEQLRQAVLMLAANAFEAVGDGDEVRISLGTLNDAAARSPALLLPEPPLDGYVLLEVADTGRGMDATTRARMFEPFFTTKTRHGGLSLAVVVGIVHSHGGTIQVDSGSELGTSVWVLLPTSSAS